MKLYLLYTTNRYSQKEFCNIELKSVKYCMYNLNKLLANLSDNQFVCKYTLAKILFYLCIALLAARKWCFSMQLSNYCSFISVPRNAVSNARTIPMQFPAAEKDKT